ncbi:MAG: hypothetical protein K0Q59_692 [Paenibacillus sp.]|jgi:hypothetical protein|nr:hypothetical protein [Paenibacillus sp.]
MRLWFRRTKSEVALLQLEERKMSAAAPLAISPDGDDAATIVHENRMQTMIDEAYNECVKNGGFEHLPGTGKPLVIPTGDPLAGLLKNANYLPPWLELQHEIRDELRELLRKHGGGSSGEPQIEVSELAEINRKVVRYNNLVPTPMLQKGRIHPDTVSKQLQSWE